MCSNYQDLKNHKNSLFLSAVKSGEKSIEKALKEIFEKLRKNDSFNPEKQKFVFIRLTSHQKEISLDEVFYIRDQLRKLIGFSNFLLGVEEDTSLQKAVKIQLSLTSLHADLNDLALKKLFE